MLSYLRTKNINTLLYQTDILGVLRGDPLHMDQNVCTKALNAAAGFASYEATYSACIFLTLRLMMGFVFGFSSLRIPEFSQT